jgi:hypothetical protein
VFFLGLRMRTLPFHPAGPPAAPRERQLKRPAAGERLAGSWPVIPNAYHFASSGRRVAMAVPRWYRTLNLRRSIGFGGVGHGLS